MKLLRKVPETAWALLGALLIASLVVACTVSAIPPTF